MVPNSQGCCEEDTFVQCLAYRTSSMNVSSLSFLWELVYIGSIGQKARKRKRKYKGRRGERKKGRKWQRKDKSPRGKGPRRIGRPRTKSPDLSQGLLPH